MRRVELVKEGGVKVERGRKEEEGEWGAVWRRRRDKREEAGEEGMRKSGRRQNQREEERDSESKSRHTLARLTELGE